MGLFKSAKRAVKKITKPVAKVLNKVVPNELKPFLPYAAAVAPYLLPAGTAGAGLLGTMKGRAFLTGGLNLTSQLAQEGNEEGDFSALSLGLAGLQGALTAPGAAETLRGMQVADTYNPELAQLGKPELVGEPLSFLDKARNVGLGTLEKAAVASEGIAGTLQDPFSASLGEFGKAAVVPFSQGSMDLGMATARQALRDYELELDAFNAQAGANQAASDADRRAAIIASMTRADFTQDIIDETLGQLGLKDGGIARLGFDNGGDVEGKIDLMGDLSKEDKKTFAGLKKLLFDATIKDRPGYAQNMLEVANPFDDKDADSSGSQERARAFDRGNKRLIYGIISTKNDPEGREKFVEEFTENYENMMYPAGRMAEGGIARLGFDNGGDVSFGGIKEAIKGVAQNNMEEDDVEDNKDKTIKEILKEMDEEKISILNPVKALKKYLIEQAGGGESRIKEANGGIAYFKDGGIMNLGGKEMDMRTGGFIPIGAKERADDVPARLSKNEFVMTADAVRAAGGGSVNQGAKRMYDLMHNLEARA